MDNCRQLSFVKRYFNIHIYLLITNYKIIKRYNTKMTENTIWKL